VVLLFAVTSMTGCPSPEPPEFHKRPIPPQITGAEGRVGKGAETALLTGPRSRGQAGDWIVRNERLAAVFRHFDGRLVDLGFRKNGRDLFHSAKTVISDTRGRYPVHYHHGRVTREKSAGTPRLELLGKVRAKGLNLEVRTLISAPSKKPFVHFETQVRNSSRRPVYRVGVGDDVYLGNSRLFVPGHGNITASSKHHAYWVGREGADYSMALVSRQSQPMKLSFRMGFQGYNPTVRATYEWAHLEPGDVVTARRALLLTAGPLARASAHIHALRNNTVQRLTLEPAASLPAPLRQRAWFRVSTAGHPVLRSRLERNTTSFVLPTAKSYRLQLVAPGTGPGKALSFQTGAAPAKNRGFPTPPPRKSPPNTKHLTAALPAFGTVTYAVVDTAGRPLPARLTIRGLGATATPEFGADGGPAGAKNMVYTASGRGRIPLAPGRYMVLVTRGVEYSWHVAELRVQPGKVTSLQAALTRQVDTPGALAADLHLHAAGSTDSELTVEARLTQLAAEGIEIGVATDHNAISSWQDSGKKKPFRRWLKTFPGCEATTRGAYFGHFNLFPLQADAPVPRYQNSSPEILMKTWKKRADDPIIQVNHPRMSFIGMFNQVDFVRKHGRAWGPGFYKQFDSLEVFNGDRLYSPDRVKQNLADWFVLLNRGLRPTATGGSDSHKLAFHEVGYPRNFLLMGKDDPRRFSAADLRDALRRHKVVVSSGPYIAISAAQKPQSLIGEQISTALRAQLTVSAPCWLPLQEVVLIANGKPHKRFSIPKASAPRRGKPCAPHLHKFPIRFVPQKDTWVVFQVKGTGHNPTLIRSDGIVWAFTNPIWIDADDDGRFTAPGNGPTPPLE
jgi:hypothetical protein